MSSPHVGIGTIDLFGQFHGFIIAHADLADRCTFRMSDGIFRVVFMMRSGLDMRIHASSVCRQTRVRCDQKRKDVGGAQTDAGA